MECFLSFRDMPKHQVFKPSFAELTKLQSTSDHFQQNWFPEYFSINFVEKNLTFLEVLSTCRVKDWTLAVLACNKSLKNITLCQSSLNRERELNICISNMHSIKENINKHNSLYSTKTSSVSNGDKESLAQCFASSHIAQE